MVGRAVAVTVRRVSAAEQGGAGEAGLTRAWCSNLTCSLMAATSLVTAEVDSAAAMKAPYWLTASSCTCRRSLSPSARSSSGSCVAGGHKGTRRCQAHTQGAGARLRLRGGVTRRYTQRHGRALASLSRL